MTSPTPPAPPPRPARGPSGASSLTGLLFGFFLCLATPPIIFGVLLGLLSGTNLTSAWQILMPVFLAVAIPIGLFYLLNRKLTSSQNPDAADFKKTLRVAGFISLAIWAVISLVFGACIALLRGAY